MATPRDLDPECLNLCRALNELPGIETISSCAGHGETPFQVSLEAESLDDLPPVAWSLDSCHSGQSGWELVAYTDCTMAPIRFLVEGPVGAYEAAEAIAELIQQAPWDEDEPDD